MPRNVLDIGCGQGICAEKITLDNINYTGVDPSTYLIDRAKELYKTHNRDFSTGNAYDLPFDDVSFDAAFTILVWHLLEFPEKAAHELARILKQNGHFLIITANPHAQPAWESVFTNIKKSGKKT